MADEATTELDPLDAATTSIREAAKWLLATFGAVGAIAFAGVALSDVSSIGDQVGLIAAVVGAGAAALGIGLAIISASNVLVSGFTTIDDVKEGEVDATLKAGYPSVKALREEYHAAIANQESDYEAVVNARDDQREALEAKLEDSNDKVRGYNVRIRPILARVRYSRVKSAFNWARGGMVAGAGLTVIGAFVFVVATSVAPGAPVVGETPVAVSVQVSSSGKDGVSALLGSECPLDEPLHGTAIATEGETVVVAIAESDDCEAAILRLAPSDASVTSDE